MVDKFLPSYLKSDLGSEVQQGRDAGNMAVLGCQMERRIGGDIQLIHIQALVRHFFTQPTDEILLRKKTKKSRYFSRFIVIVQTMEC